MPPRPWRARVRGLAPYCKLREPFNGYSHLAGALLSVVGLLLLTQMSLGKPWHSLGFAVYGASLVLLYTASTLYHSLPAGPRGVERLLVLDQVAIYLLIAGTYTPVCLVALRESVGLGLLAAVWGLAALGIALRVGWRSAPRWVPIVFYLILGWLCMSVLGPLQKALPPAALGWLLSGGVIYSVGAAILVLGRPCLRPGVFGSHELWHCFVLAGSACHYAMMVQYVLPLP